MDNINEINSNNNYNDYELNSMDYFEAMEKDNRKFLSIYWSLLKREHLILFTFFSRDDYNIFSIKLAKFFYSISTDMAFNVLFFSDESMHNIYKSGGIYNFLEQLYQTIISTLLSQSLQVFLNYLSMTDIYYYQIKSFNKNEMIKYKFLKTVSCIKYKLIIFYLFTFLLFIFYWYLVSTFCAVYVNTQKIFITNSLFSFILGLIYPIGLYFIPTSLRLLSLKSKKRNLSIIYKLSNLIPLF